MSILELSAYQFASPRHLDEACRLLSELASQGIKAIPIAGCTDWMVERHATALTGASGTAIDVTRIPELRGIRQRDGVISVGAAETFQAIRRDPTIARHCPMMAEASASVGAPAIQARGTLGGNLVTGSPAADGVVALFALDAQVVLASEKGERNVPVRQFYTGYRASVRKSDELVVRFTWQVPAAGSIQRWRKVGTRSAQAISKAAVAMVAELDGGVIQRVGLAAGSVAPSVRALYAAMKLLKGCRVAQVDLADVERAVDGDIEPIDDLRSTARYRRHVVRTLVRRFVEEIAVKK